MAGWSSAGPGTSTPSAATTCRRPSSGPSCSSTCPGSHYPERLNAATALLDDVIARARRRPAVPAASPAGRPGPTPTCWRRRTGSRTCSSRTSGSCPATGCCCAGRTTSGSSACWFGVLKAGAVAGHHDAAAAQPASWPTIHEIAPLDVGAVRPPVPRRRRAAASAYPWSPSAATTRRPDARAAAHAPTFDDVAHLGRRRRDAGVHLRHHRPPQGDDALPPRRARRSATPSPRHVLQPIARRRVHRHAAATRSPSGSAALLLFPLHAGASTLLVEKATPAELAGPDRRARRDDLLHRTHGVQGDARRRQRLGV